MKVGFIGLGNVGGKLAGSLLRNGIDLTVHDLDVALVDAFTDRGAKWGGSPAAMMRACDVVITCLPSPAASAEVMAEMLPEMAPGKIWMEMSTTDADEIVRIGTEVEATGGLVVECPVGSDRPSARHTLGDVAGAGDGVAADAEADRHTDGDGQRDDPRLSERRADR